MGIVERIAGRRSYIDVNVFIYALEAHPQYLPTVRELFSAIDRGDITAVTSELSLAEALVKPFIDRRQDLQDIYIKAIAPAPFLSIQEVTRNVLVASAQIRAENNVRLPDAIHLATAQLSNCRAFLTNDSGLKSFKDLEVIQLADFILPH